MNTHTRTHTYTHTHTHTHTQTPFRLCVSSSGSPKYFGPILHYLRTSVIDIPPNYTLSSIRMEAEFYGIQKIVDHIDYLTTEKQEQRGNRDVQRQYVVIIFLSQKHPFLLKRVAMLMILAKMRTCSERATMSYW